MDSGMSADTRPTIGFTQPGTGSLFRGPFRAMGRNSKGHRPPAMIRQVIAMNVRALRDQRYADLPNETARNKQLAEDAATTLSQIQRVIAQDLGTSVDFVEQLASALGCRPQDLLTPYFLSTAHPPPEYPPEAEPREPDSLQRHGRHATPQRTRR